MTAFEEFGVLPEIAKAVEEMEWTLPTDVQAEAVPLILGGGDVLMAAETGSGKTGAFCLPILQTVWETLRDLKRPPSETGRTGSVGGPQQWTMSVHDRSAALAVTADGLRCQSREPRDWHGGRATSGLHLPAGDGCYHYEATVTDEGLCRIGWSTQRAVYDLGTDVFGFGYGGTGKRSNARQFDDYGEPFGLGDVIGCTLDLSSGEMRFARNGNDLGRAFIVPNALRGETFYPAVVLKNAEMAMNFGATPFRFEPPAGARPCTAAPTNTWRVNPAGVAARLAPPQPNAPQAVIIEPSRELAEQVVQQLEKFAVHLSEPTVRTLLLVGGVAVREQLATLRRGVDICVATPGRLEDLIGGGHLSLESCRFFVLDEADALLQAGHTKLIDSLHRQMPKQTADGRRLQMVVCSATLHAMEVRRMAERLMQFPVWIDLKGEDAVPESVHHVVVQVDPRTDESWKTMRTGAGGRIRTDGVHARDSLGVHVQTAEQLSEAVKWLKGEYLLRAIREHRMDRALLFCRTKLDCDNVERWLRESDPELTCVCLHGDRAPAERKANLAAFKAEKVRFMICTDVAARGLDITGLPYMINVTMPDEKANYVHRIGRVGRADRMGLAISLVGAVPEKVWYHGQWCSSHGKNCSNTQLTDRKGCCIWYNERNLLAEVEDVLNITIEQIDAANMKVPTNEFDGRVVYGQKRQLNAAGAYLDHVGQLLPVVQRLSDLERNAQQAFIRRAYAV